MDDEKKEEKVKEMLGEEAMTHPVGPEVSEEEQEMRRPVGPEIPEEKVVPDIHPIGPEIADDDKPDIHPVGPEIPDDQVVPDIHPVGPEIPDGDKPDIHPVGPEIPDTADDSVPESIKTTPSELVHSGDSVGWQAGGRCGPRVVSFFPSLFHMFKEQEDGVSAPSVVCELLD